MKILFLVHVEEIFRPYFPDSMYVNRLRRAMGLYDRIICLVSEVDDIHPIPEIVSSPHYYEQWQWGWGYEKEMFPEESEHEWIIATSSPHGWTWVPPELRDLKEWQKHEILVGGGYSSECLQDFRDVLGYVGINYRLIDGYCY